MIDFDEKLKNKIYACWLGKTIAGGLGAPFEGNPYSLNLAQDDLLLDTGPNDDLELQLLWLIFAEKYGMSLDSDKLSEAWLDVIEYGMDEYGVAIWNLRRGLKPPMTGYVDNYFTDGMGAAIRSEIWACLCPGNPEAAAYFASCDASVDHCGEGVWAEMFLAAAESSAFLSDSLEKALESGLKYVSSDSNVFGVVKYVMNMYASGTDLKKARTLILEKFGSHNFTYCVMNLGFIISALLYGEGDFDQTVLTAVNFGYDTDCTAATAGGLFGIFYGTNAIPDKWKTMVNDTINVSEFLDSQAVPKSVMELTYRTFALAEQLSHTSEMEKPFPLYLPISAQEYPFPASKWQVITGERKSVEQFRGIHMDISEFAKDNANIDLITGISVQEDLEGQLMLCTGTGITAWLDGRQILNYHGRLKPIPAFHRTEGGASVPVSLKAGRSYSLKIRLYFCRPPLTLTVALGDMKNQYAVGAKFTVDSNG